MARGHGGSYWGRVVDDQDPAGEQRLQVVVPEIFGDAGPVWARACREPGDDRPLPAIDDEVWIWFEAGDTDYPVWHRPAEAGADQPLGDEQHGYVGVFRGRVVNNLDPLELQRIEVVVPEIALDPMWARPSDSMAGAAVPEIDAEVWIEFEAGDATFPIWVGAASL